MTELDKEMLELMIKWESEGLDKENTQKLFQYLIDTGDAWRLQGFYGRTAMTLILRGVCQPTPDLIMVKGEFNDN